MSLTILFQLLFSSRLLEDFNVKCIQTQFLVDLSFVQVTSFGGIVREKLIYILERQTMLARFLPRHLQSIVAFQHYKWVEFSQQSSQLMNKFYMFALVQCRQSGNIIDCIEDSSSECFCWRLPELRDVNLNSFTVFGLIQPTFIVGKSPVERFQMKIIKILKTIINQLKKF